MRPFKIEVIVRSTTPGPDGTPEVQQEVPVLEYSDDAEIHVIKNFHIAKAVTNATMQAMEELAQAAGFITTLPEVTGGNGKAKAKSK